MKKVKFSLLRFSTLITLAILLMYCSSVQEVHYLFVDHHIELNEHCHNHLHSQTGHLDCNLCKIDLGSFVSSYAQFDKVGTQFYASNPIATLSHLKLFFQQSAASPRGPPSLGC